MLRSTRARIALATATAALAVGAATPASGAIVAGNLVGVGVDVNNNQILDQNEVIAQVPVGVAADVCGVNTAVLAQQRNQGSVGCTATSDAIATVPGPFQPKG